MKRKLVRDKIPEIANNNDLVFRICKSKEEYHELLKDKILEEHKEYCESHNPEELADIIEVILAISELNGITHQELENIRMNKRSSRGSFFKRIVMTTKK